MRPHFRGPVLVVKASLRPLVEQGIAALRTAGTLPADAETPAFVVERPKDRTHGDFSTNAAMTLAKAARWIVSTSPASSGWMSRMTGESVMGAPFCGRGELSGARRTCRRGPRVNYYGGGAVQRERGAAGP